MTSPDLTAAIYHDEEAARVHLESIRWPDGKIVCPHCGGAEKARQLAGNSMGPGWFYCGDCKDKFTVRTGTVYERSKIALHKWLLGFRLYAASKKGFSAHQLHRTLGITYKSAWFMAHRIREAMRDDDPTPLGGRGKHVEVDETFTGPNDYVFVTGRGWQKRRGAYAKPWKIVALVERGGRARTVTVENLDIPTLRAIVLGYASTDSTLQTDQAQHYKFIGQQFARHQHVNHGKREYARKDGASTNTVEGFFSIFKRGMTGVYQHCGEQHLQRYLNEFQFRYSNRVALGVDDAMRTKRVIEGADGKRLTYRQARQRAA